MEQPAAQRRHHPVSTAVARARDTFGGLVETPLWSMSEDEVAATLMEAGRLRAQVEELELRLACEADRRGAGTRSGAPSTGAWWAVETRQTRPAAIGRMTFATALEEHDLTRTALAGGHLTVDQAKVIVRAVDAIPDDIDRELIVQAEQHLLLEATRYDAKTLAIVGKRILTVIAPEVGEERDARALEAEEREARASAFLTMCPDGHGSVIGKFKIPTLHGSMLRKALYAFAAPKHRAATKDRPPLEDLERRPSPERMGDAFCELLERLPVKKMPTLGGLNISVVATVQVEDLLRNLGHGVLDDGGIISIPALRRLACEAGILPAILGSKSEVLDLGRSSRFFSRAQNTALNIAQPQCTTVGCDWPAYLCHSHHDDTWALGGLTDLSKGRKLCPSHHARIHDPAYETTHHPDGQVSFHRRT